MNAGTRNTIFIVIAILGLLAAGIAVVFSTLNGTKSTGSETESSVASFTTAKGVILPTDLPSNAPLLPDLVITEASKTNGVFKIVQTSTKTSSDLIKLISTLASGSGWNQKSSTGSLLSLDTSVQTATVEVTQNPDGTSTVTTTITPTGSGGGTISPVPSSSTGSSPASSTTPSASTSPQSTATTSPNSSPSPTNTIITTE